MGSLLDFLVANPVDGLTEVVVVSERLKDYPFTIRAVSSDEFTDYQKSANRFSGRGSKRTADFDSKLFNELVVLNHTSVPDFKDAAAIKTAGCHTPKQFLNRSVLAGEVMELAERILELSGFGEDIDALVDEAKNFSGRETVKQATPTSAS